MKTVPRKKKKAKKEFFLSQDEIFCILSFLDLGCILNFALVNHEIYEKVYQSAKIWSPEVFEEKWSIINAFKPKIYIQNTTKQEILFKKFHIIHHLFNLYNTDIIKNLPQKNKVKKLTLYKPGHLITPKELEYYLSILPNLEEMVFVNSLYFEKGFEKNLKLTNLKKVKIIENNRETDYILNWILKSSPNLEKIELRFLELGFNIYDQLFSCHSLQELYIESFLSREFAISDENVAKIINKCSNLKSFTLLCGNDLIGTFLEMIDENSILKYLHIEDMYPTSTITHVCNLKKQIHFLRVRKIIGFQVDIDSIQKNCKNLENIEIKPFEDPSEFEYSDFDEKEESFESE